MKRCCKRGSMILTWQGLFVLLTGIALAFFFPAQAQNNDTSLASYRLDAGDLINITVFGESDLSLKEVRITESGTISYPILGEIRVAGKTVGEIEKLITEQLKGRYLVNPQVSIQIVEYRPFFINGMVAKPGSYPFQPGLTVRKAVAIAGGFKERANPDKIYLIREKDPQQRPERAQLDTPVFPGDLITVEESFF